MERGSFLTVAVECNLTLVGLVTTSWMPRPQMEKWEERSALALPSIVRSMLIRGPIFGLSECKSAVVWCSSSITTGTQIYNACNAANSRCDLKLSNAQVMKWTTITTIEILGHNVFVYSRHSHLPYVWDRLRTAGNQ